MGFVQWYNHSHLHSALKYVTPVQRHMGSDLSVLKHREKVYAAAKEKHPLRWSGETRNWDHEQAVTLNPDKEEHIMTLEEQKEAA